jgi:hypothetical protein
MPRSIPDIKKPAAKRTGRPRTTGTGFLVGTRWHRPDLDAIDGFAQAEQIERAEAIRRLVRLGVAKTRKKQSRE